MKYSFLLILFFVFSCAPKQKITPLPYPKPFEFELIDTLHADKNTIYVKAHEWISKTYGSAKTVIDMQDKEAGKLIGKAIIEVPKTFAYVGGVVTAMEIVNYIISIDVKEGRYRCVISNFNHTGGTYITRSSTNKTVSYYNLQSDTLSYKNESGVRVVDRHYFNVKNTVMIHSQALLKDLKEKMHTPDKEF